MCGGINGNSTDGSDSIVVSRKVENDYMYDMHYTCTTREGSGALYVNMKYNIPVRVFRSSKPTTSYAPSHHIIINKVTLKIRERTSYIYDGLFSVASCKLQRGESTFYLIIN